VTGPREANTVAQAGSEDAGILAVGFADEDGAAALIFFISIFPEEPTLDVQMLAILLKARCAWNGAVPREIEDVPGLPGAWRFAVVAEADDSPVLPT